MDFPEVTLKEANKQRLKAYTCARECKDCGDFRRFILSSDWCCWTCYLGESEGTKNINGLGTLNRSESTHNLKVIKARKQLTGIPRVFGSYNSGSR